MGRKWKTGKVSLRWQKLQWRELKKEGTEGKTCGRKEKQQKAIGGDSFLSWCFRGGNRGINACRPVVTVPYPPAEEAGAGQCTRWDTPSQGSCLLWPCLEEFSASLPGIPSPTAGRGSPGCAAPWHFCGSAGGRRGSQRALRRFPITPSLRNSHLVVPTLGRLGRVQGWAWPLPRRSPAALTEPAQPRTHGHKHTHERPAEKVTGTCGYNFT